MSAQRDATAWLCHELRLAGGDARGRVQVARDTHLLAAPLAAAADGSLRFDHVRAIAAATRPLAHDPVQRQAGIGLLTDLAGVADPAAVRRAGRRLGEVLDPDGATRTREEQYARRCVHLSPLLDGMTAIDGILDAEAAATLSAAIAPLMVPADTDDRRSAGQRRADALVEVAALALKTTDLPVLSGTTAAIDLLVPTQALPGTDHGIDTPGRPSGLALGGGVVHHAPGGPLDLPTHTVARLMCDAAIGRVVMAPAGVPLQLGRRTRLFSKDQRRALHARDGGCRAPGCTRPPRYTDAHHIVPWETGGATDLTNAILLCRYHHTLIHHHHRPWQITVDNPDQGANGPLTFTGPAGQHTHSHPRAP